MLRFILSAALALPAAILLIPAFIAAGVLYLYASAARGLARLLEPRFVPWASLMAFDASLGWKPRPNLDARYLAERDDVFRVVTDKEGWPGTRSLDDSSVVVIGDSFAFGYGVDVGRSFADLSPAVPIKAVGAPGYSMVHSVMLMEQFAERLAGKLVVWFVCLENDLQDNLMPTMRTYRTPFVRAGRGTPGWTIVNQHVTAEPWRWSDGARQRILPTLCTLGPISDRAFDASDYLIGRGATQCRSVGASLVLVTIPDPTQLTDVGRARLAESSGDAASFDADLPDRRLAEICRRHGVPMIAGKGHLTASDYKPIEGLHWNRRGHRQMAGVLKELYDSFRAGKLAVSAVSQPRAGDTMPVLYQSSPAGSR